MDRIKELRDLFLGGFYTLLIKFYILKGDQGLDSFSTQFHHFLKF